MPELLTEREVFLLAEVVTPGGPGGPSQLACRRCGVLLWDIAKHYRHDHPDVDLHPQEHPGA